MSRILRRFFRLYLRLVRLGLARARDLAGCTYASRSEGLEPLELGEMVSVQPGILPPEVAALYFDNRHDLLGSGWRDWSAPAGPDPVNAANRGRARQLRNLISANHRSLDWHLDVRAGHRWPAARWSRWIRPGQPPGVDIKLPWELARMQYHLPLALDAMQRPDRLAASMRLFRDQVLDFMASNPPRFGVNWRTPMDVAIRAANWVIVYSLYRSIGERFDTDFERALGASLIDHGRHIVNYMEWDPVWRANHYLANLCGLGIIAAVLPPDAETDAWLAFSCAELAREVERQINPDGSVFEASTGYHRLSVEMVVYATAVLLGHVQRDGPGRIAKADLGAAPFIVPTVGGAVPFYPVPGQTGVETPFSPTYFQRLAAAGGFLNDITKPDGHVVLVGDNDSGRFLRTRFVGENLSWADSRARYANLEDVPDVPGIAECPIEDQRDHRYLLGALAGLIDAPQLGPAAERWGTEYALVRALSGGLAATVPLPEPPPRVPGRVLAQLPARARCLRIPMADSEVFEGLRTCAYPDFGLYLWRSPRLFLALRCGPIGQGGFGGHAHNDQLMVELQVDGRDLISDPGVYRYTVDPAERRRYRSVLAHFSPRVGDLEPGNLDMGPWRLGDEARATLEYFDGACIQARHHGFGAALHRRVWREPQAICIADWGDDGLQPDDPAEHYARLNRDGALAAFCPGYGVQHA